MNRFSALAFLASLFLPAPLLAQQAGQLTITTWGGAYEAAQRVAYVDPFRRKFKLEVRLKPYNGGLDALRRQGTSATGGWDVLDMTEPDAIAACEEGLLVPFDAGTLTPAPDGTPAGEDFLEGAFKSCGVIHLVYATVIAYDDRAFPGEKPRRAADLFDLKRFPGKRALRREPIALLEWALMSYGVPVSQLRDLLSTERGMRLAFRKLDVIRDHIVWWSKGSEPPELLKSGKVVMASGFNGRFFSARVNDQAPIRVIWDGQFLDTGVWVIARQSPRRAQAEAFIRFATRAENMAAFAELIPYGPMRRSAMSRIGLHAKSNMPLLHDMPTSPANLQNAIRADSVWYARTDALRKRWFKAWLERGK